MKRIQLLTSLSVILALTSTPAFSVQSKYKKKPNYKNETLTSCPVGLMLKDGFYMGAALGYDSYRVGNDLSATSPAGDTASWNTILNPVGVNGGGFIGFGKYLHNFYDLYLAIEAFGLATSAETNSKLVTTTSLVPGSLTVSNKIKSEANYGISLIPGIKLNTGSLLYLRLGYNWANLSIDQSISGGGTTFFDSSESERVHGFNYGLGIETALYNNFSMRFEYNHTDYNSFDANVYEKVSPADNQLLLGLLYHFNKSFPMIAPLTPCETLKSGFYFGVAAGYDSYQMGEDFTVTGTTTAVTFSPELSMNGALGGGILGYGQYFNRFFGPYLGIEVFGNATEAIVESKLSAQPASSTTPSTIKSKIKLNSNYGVGLLPGIRLNAATLFYLRAGYNWAVIRSEETFSTEGGLSLEDNETNTVHGLNYGLGMEFATSNNSLTVRPEFSHTDYSSFNTSNLKISPADNQFMLAVIYHIV